MNTIQKRLTSIKVRISDIANEEFIKMQGFEPSYVITKDGEKISRARILGTVLSIFISEDKNYASVTIDDFSDNIKIKMFKDVSIMENLKNGDLIDIIGKIREYNNEIYIIAEIIRIVEPNFELLRRLEILIKKIEQNKKRKLINKVKNEISDEHELFHYMKTKYNINEDEIKILSKQKSTENNDKEKNNIKQHVLKTITELDNENGVSIEDLINAFPSDDINIVITSLLKDSLIFETLPGKYKKV